MHYPDILLFAESCTLVGRIREIMAARSIGEAEVRAWSATIRRAFIPPPEASSPSDCSCDASGVLQLIKRQSEQIEVLILQNKRLEDRQLALEAQLRTQLDILAISERPSGQPAVTPSASQVQPTVRPTKKGSQSLSTVWYEWFTAEPRVYVSRYLKKTALNEFRHAVGYMMLFLPMGFALDEASPAFKSETLNLGQKAEANTLVFLKANGSSALAAGTALKALRKLVNSMLKSPNSTSALPTGP
ncbi:unnamed protein product [Phytophthora fragariaefolia]|uniref:Unnamed protein product n=1 Tax=Phytophthora fragariaefolia TaxID=1490495 RepID=A0A9W6X1Y4_9STRA|nr:unnamed protein product [Phytophthora fragariaefolia]